MSLNKIAVFLRKDWKVNRFRDVIISTFNSSDISEMILCSGFFQENKYFNASDDFKNICIHNAKTLRLVGVYDYRWRISYFDFHDNVIKNNCSSCLSVHKYRIPGMRWHAKIMIGKKDKIPVIATIGSSNITGRAFGLSKNYNYESDVVFWDDSINGINELVTLSIEKNMNNADEIFISNYDENDWRNGQQPLAQKILQLEKDIFDIAKIID